MSGKLIVAYKPEGKTPLQVVNTYKQKKEFEGSKIGYAGRLDPMAEGLLLLLVGELNAERKKYERLQKTYEFEVLFGIKTDSYDILGIPKLGKGWASNIAFESIAKRLVKTQTQKYPPYSSPKVRGKPLFWWARAGRLKEINVPAKKIEITKASFYGSYTISAASLLGSVLARIDIVDGDFRQELIKKKWSKVLANVPDKNFLVGKFIITCTGGTYVRSIANSIGRGRGGAIALKIKRTKVGKYSQTSYI